MLHDVALQRQQGTGKLLGVKHGPGGSSSHEGEESTLSIAADEASMSVHSSSSKGMLFFAHAAIVPKLLEECISSDGCRVVGMKDIVEHDHETPLVGSTVRGNSLTR